MRVSRVRAVRGEVCEVEGTKRRERGQLLARTRRVVLPLTLFRARRAIQRRRNGRQTNPLGSTSELVVPQRSVDRDDPIGSSLGEDGLDSVLGVLDVLLDERDREDLLFLVGSSSRGGGDSSVKKSGELLEDGGFQTRFLEVSSDVEMLLEVVLSGST